MATLWDDSTKLMKRWLENMQEQLNESPVYQEMTRIELARLAEEKTASVSEPFLLRKATLKLSKVATAEEARQALLKLSEGH